MTRISQGDRIARMPGATVHIARVAYSDGWTALCGYDVSRPTRLGDVVRPSCPQCAAIEKRGATK